MEGWNKMQQILGSFLVHNTDEAGDPKYYGYVAPNGHWYIMKSTGGTEFRFSFGTSDYSTNWTGRAALTYTTLDAAI